MEELNNTHLNKHIAAIHCSNNISLLQRKIYNALLSKAYNRLLKDDFHYISLSELSKLIGFNSKATDKLKAAFKKLQSTSVEWNILEKGTLSEEIWCSSTLLASAVIDNKKGYCQYEYSKTLAALLYQPEIYARINLNIQNKFGSSYGLALYENCIRFKRVKTTGWISIETFRKLMGVSEFKYKKYSDFSKRVVSPALSEINEVSDIHVKLEVRRIAQKVVSLKFNISTKRTQKPLGINVKTTQKHSSISALRIKKLLKEGFAARDQDITVLLNSYSLQYISEKINIIIMSESYKSGRVKVPIALLKSALKDDYKPPKKETDSFAIKPRITFSQEQKDGYQLYCKKYMLRKFLALEHSEQERIKALFLDRYRCSNLPSDQVIFQVYSTHGLKSVETEFVQFAVSVRAELTDGMDDFETYIQPTSLC